jgi:16S rRNA (uracil1498-N3)-methyltransferase
MTLRIFLPRPWAEGESLALPKAESRHVQVLRLQPGDRIVLFDGEAGAEWPAEIVRIDRSEVAVRVGAPMPVDRELPFAVTLALGVPANERMDPLIEKATELGVAAIQPLMCERSVVRLAGDRAEARQRHWSAVAASASEQCGRVFVPEIAVPARFGAWLEAAAAGDDAAAPPARSTRRRIGAGPEVRWLLSLASDAAVPTRPELSLRPPSVIVLSGPEGGLSPAEESAARAEGFSPVTLGPRTLRADTAPLALLAWLGLAAHESAR